MCWKSACAFLIALVHVSSSNILLCSLEANKPSSFPAPHLLVSLGAEEQFGGPGSPLSPRNAFAPLFFGAGVTSLSSDWG